MKRSSIIQGTAHWAYKEFGAKLPSFSPVRIGLVGIDKLAQLAPEAVEAMLAATPFGTASKGIIAAAETNFSATAKSLEESIRAEEKLVLSFPTPLGPIFVTLTASSIPAIVKEIETAEANRQA